MPWIEPNKILITQIFIIIVASPVPARILTTPNFPMKNREITSTPIVKYKPMINGVDKVNNSLNRDLADTCPSSNSTMMGQIYVNEVEAEF